jgi:hypothetical protein
MSEEECEEAQENELVVLQSMYDEAFELLEPVAGLASFRLSIVSADEEAPSERRPAVKMVVTYEKGYPFRTPPTIRFENHCGLSDVATLQLQELVQKAANETLGEGMIFQLVEHTQECLLKFNLAGECPICLLSLEDQSKESAALQTPCGHRFHGQCLAEYWTSQWETGRLDHLGSPTAQPVFEADVQCPSCRQKLVWKHVPELAKLLGVDEKEGEDKVQCITCTLFNAATNTKCDACGAPFVFNQCNALAQVSEQRRSLQSSGHGPISNPSGTTEEKTNEKKQLVIPRSYNRSKETLSTDPRGDAERMVFEVVHHKGTCFRQTPKNFNKRVPNGYVPRGTTGYVAEISGEYIRPLGSKLWLPICGRSSKVKLLHVATESEYSAASGGEIVGTGMFAAAAKEEAGGDGDDVGAAGSGGGGGGGVRSAKHHRTGLTRNGTQRIITVDHMSGDVGGDVGGGEG